MTMLYLVYCAVVAVEWDGLCDALRRFSTKCLMSVDFFIGINVFYIVIDPEYPT